MMQRVYTHLLRHSRTQRCPCRSVTSQVPRTAPLKKPFWKDANNYLLICPITCVGLAIWQVKRKEWKENLIDTIKERYEMDPIQLPKDLSTVKDFDLYPVKVRGHFDYANEVYIGPRSDTPERRHQTLGGKVSGVYVITPFKLADRDESILVNRGWIENDYFALEENRKKAQ
ncbi:SURF1-like protein, partial [Ruditapes philippinarum]|uniref:SURF1-like protein n=1 Tax=Ruditapes philippinarum TaxID=129788 RepID=UPI00295A9D56